VTPQFADQRYFEDVAVGEQFEEEQQPTTEHVVSFVNTTGQLGGDGRFTDVAKARAAGLEHAIVPGQMSASMLTRLVSDWMGPLGRVLSVDVSYRRPILHGDRLRCIALVTDLNGEGDFEGTGTGAVHLDVTMENERGEQPVLGTAVVVLPRRIV
jgi:acyl dehydratase